MKRIINLIITIVGAAFLASCTTSGRIMDSAPGYGYYDNMYYNGYPGYYGPNAYLHQRPVIIHKDVIVVPEKEKIRKRNTVQRKSTVTPGRRKNVIQNESNRTINRNNTPSRRNNTTVAPHSRSSVSPATRGTPRAGSRRGGN